MQLTNKIIVVTGAGSGINRALTLRLLEKKARVAGIDLKLDALLETQKIACVDEDASLLDFLYRLPPEYATNFIQKKMSELLVV